MDALVVLAYKGQLAMACKANSMVSALEIHREMKSKGIKQDLSVSEETSEDWVVLLFPVGRDMLH